MTWSISTSGPKDEVEKYLEDLDTPDNLSDAEANDFEGALTHALLSVTNAEHHVSVSAGGYRSGDTMQSSVSIGHWKPADAQAA